MFTGTFTVASSNESLNARTFTDTSDNTSEPVDTFSDRKLYLYDLNNNLLGPDGAATYWDFNYTDYPENVITVTGIDPDVVVFALMVWVSIDPQDNSTYSANTIVAFDDNTQQFKYELITRMAFKRGLQHDDVFMTYLKILQLMLDSCDKAVYYQDHYAAQRCIDNARNIIANQQNYF